MSLSPAVRDYVKRYSRAQIAAPLKHGYRYHSLCRTWPDWQSGKRIDPHLPPPDADLWKRLSALVQYLHIRIIGVDAIALFARDLADDFKLLKNLHSMPYCWGG